MLFKNFVRTILFHLSRIFGNKILLLIRPARVFIHQMFDGPSTQLLSVRVHNGLIHIFSSIRYVKYLNSTILGSSGQGRSAINELAVINCIGMTG